MENRDLVVKVIDGSNFSLVQDFNFYFEEETITIPKGFITDFGSVPQIFQSFVSPIGKPTKAYVLHDYLCVKAKKGELSRKEADEIFLKAMKRLKVRKIKRKIIYFYVRLYAILKGLK